MSYKQKILMTVSKDNLEFDLYISKKWQYSTGPLNMNSLRI